jgi:hypothetical protein
MGVTIHFEGRVQDEAAYLALLDTATAFANRHHWPVQSIHLKEAALLRVRDEQDWDYSGPVKGVIIHPHEDCDTVRLEFDRDLYIQEFTKTQFAGAQIHLRVLELLRALEPFFTELAIEDEGEYWETKDLQLLESHIEHSQSAIDAELRKDPAARVKVRTPGGKIMDLYR